MSDDRFDRGLAVRRGMFSTGGAEKQIDAATDYTQPMRGHIKRDCFGEVWNRPRPDRCTQSRPTKRVFVTISKPHEVRAYVRGAIANGTSKETPELHHKPSNQVEPLTQAYTSGFALALLTKDVKVAVNLIGPVDWKARS